MNRLAVEASKCSAKSLDALLRDKYLLNRIKYIARRFPEIFEIVEMDDIIQEVLTRITEKIHSYIDRGRFFAWTDIITRHVCWEMRRRCSKEKAFSIYHVRTGPDPRVEEPKRFLIKQAMNKLNKDEQALIMLYLHEQYTMEEIATIYRSKRTTISSRIQKALSKMRIFIQQDAPRNRKGRT